MDKEACMASLSLIAMVDVGELLQKVCGLIIGSLPLVGITIYEYGFKIYGLCRSQYYTMENNYQKIM